MDLSRRLQVLFLLALVSAAAAPAALGANLARFTDARGDTCCTEDIGEVVVSNDDAGTIRFAITAPEVEGRDSSDRFVSISTERGEFTILPAEGVGGYELTRRRPSGFDLSLGSVRASHRGDVFRFWLDRHRLGDADRFGFRIEFYSTGSLGTEWDRAPDFPELWPYEVKIAVGRLRPMVGVRQHGVRGSRLTARLALHLGRSDRLLASGTISCAASVGGRRLRVLRRLFAGRRALCVWEVPPRARGKVVRGSIGVRISQHQSSLRRRSFQLLLT
jgi:hypothetical protein